MQLQNRARLNTSLSEQNNKADLGRRGEAHAPRCGEFCGAAKACPMGRVVQVFDCPGPEYTHAHGATEITGGAPLIVAPAQQQDGGAGHDVRR